MLMKITLILLIVSVVSLITAVCYFPGAEAPLHVAKQSSYEKTVRAFNERDERARKWMKAIWPLYGDSLETDYARKERWKNFRAEIPKFVKAENVVRVEVLKATDTGEFIVMLIDVDGERTSFWTLGKDIDQALQVRSITPY